MKDEDIRHLLRRVRPGSPPAGLRARIVAARPAPSGPWWLTAAAALLVATAGLQWAATGHRQSMRPAVTREAADQSPLTEIGQALDLTDVELQALAMKQEFDESMAAEQAARQNPR